MPDIRPVPRRQIPAGYIRMSTVDDEALYELQRLALLTAGVPDDRLFIERTASRRDERPQLTRCLASLVAGDTLVVWRLDRLCHNLHHMIGLLRRLTSRHIHLRVLKTACGRLDTVEPQGQAFQRAMTIVDEFQRQLDAEKESLREFPRAARKKGRKPLLDRDQLLLAQMVMKDGNANIREFCRQIGVTSTTLYRYIAPDGSFREKGQRVIAKYSGEDET